jgi:hypothetical protein
MQRRASSWSAPAVVALGGWLWALPLRAQAVQRAIHDSASADSIRFDQAPLPGGAAAVFRFLFNSVPQWIQIGGVTLGVIVGTAVLMQGWRHRQALWRWLVTRSRGAKIAMASSVFLALGIVGAAGAWSWNYMMHDNNFCSSCHVMKSAFGRFQQSEHDKLECHACHQQSIFASAKELYYWVLDRPEKIPEHAPVPNRICGECHEQRQADSTWKRIIATAGHSVHFTSDSSSLKGLMCVDCHAREVHAFAAVDVSCGASGCHEDTKVRLGAMADQSGLHCVTCHDFGRSVSERVAVDSTRQALIPARQECFSCHEMKEKLAAHDLDKDPHEATCGTCHNPHDQKVADQAFRSCATAGCHANADTLTAFHRGLGKHTLEQCGACHKPHSWKVVSTRCVDCHPNPAALDRRRTALRAAPTGVRDTVPALLPVVGHERDAGVTRPRASSEASHPHDAPREPASSAVGRRRGGPHDPGVDFDSWMAPALDMSAPAAVAPDTLTFRHTQHRKVDCETCHRSSREHGELVVKAPADCQGCHHAADQRAGVCTACHGASEVTAPRAVTTTMRLATGRGRPAVQRTLTFEHTRHERQSCVTCHVVGNPATVNRACESCHADHHAPASTCLSCHQDSRDRHTREAHLECASCHPTTAAVQGPRRVVCLTCHSAQRAHYPDRECETCHRSGWSPAGALPSAGQEATW